MKRFREMSKSSNYTTAYKTNLNSIPKFWREILWYKYSLIVVIFLIKNKIEQKCQEKLYRHIFQCLICSHHRPTHPRFQYHCHQSQYSQKGAHILPDSSYHVHSHHYLFLFPLYITFIKQLYIIWIFNFISNLSDIFTFSKLSLFLPMISIWILNPL